MSCKPRPAFVFAALLVFTAACGQSPYSDFNATPPNPYDPGTTTPTNLAPIVSLGFNQTVDRNTQIVLTATASDPDQDPLTYTWTQIAGPPVAFTGGATSAITFTSPDAPVTMTFQCTVSDGKLTASDSVTVKTVNSAPWIDTSSLLPTAPDTTTDLLVSMNATDWDNDPLTITTQWFVNGVEKVGETTDTLAAANFVRDDVVSVTVTVSDGVLSDSVTLNTTIGDAAPEITATLPTAAVYGQALVGASITAVDPDGDSFTMKLAYGPNGMTMDAAGAINWTPSGVMFDTTMDFHWGVEFTSAYGTDILSGTITVTDATRQRPLARSGIRLASTGDNVTFGDFDNDGKIEILMAGETESFGGGKILSTLEFDGVDYVEDWVYPFDLIPGGAIRSIATYDADGDAFPEIVIAGAGNEIIVLDGATKNISRKIVEANASVIYAMRIADINASGDGVLELAYLMYDTVTSLYVLVMRSLADDSEILRKGGVDHGRRLQVGNVDSDAALELVTSEGYVYDGATGTNQWLHGGGFPTDDVSNSGWGFHLADVDGNGTPEIVTFDIFNDTVIAYDADTDAKKEIWRYALTRSSDLFTVLDVDGDGKAELLTTDWVGGDAHIYAYNSAVVDPFYEIVESQVVAAPDDGGQWVKLADVDNDGFDELVWGMGLNTTGENSLIVASFLTGDANLGAWYTTPSAAGDVCEFSGGFSGGYWMNVAPGDNRAVFLSQSTNSGYDDGVFVSMLPDGSIEHTPMAPFINYTPTFVPGDIDNNGDHEIYLATDNMSWGVLGVYEFNTINTPAWELANTGAVAVVAVDLNADLKDDFIALGKDATLTAHDPAGQTVLWAYGQLETNGVGAAMEHVDIVGDAAPEIIALTQKSLFLLSRNTAQLDPVDYTTQSVALPASGDGRLAIGDFDGDGAQEIAVASLPTWGTQAIWIYESDLTLQSECAPPHKAIGLFAEPGAAPKKNVMIASNDAPYTLAAIDPYLCALIWRSPAFYGRVAKDTVTPRDVDGDGNIDLTFGTRAAMYITR